MTSRQPAPTEIDALAALWHDGWHEAHAGLLPEALVRLRTLHNFRARLEVALPRLRVTGPIGQPVGLCIVKGDELHQLYVSPSARGSGAARALLDDAEARLRQAGVGTAWLSCAIGNRRAARFYEKAGWWLAGTMVYKTDTPDGLFPLEVWRFEKTLDGRG